MQNGKYFNSLKDSLFLSFFKIYDCSKTSYEHLFFFTIHHSVVFCRLLLALVHLNLNVIVMI